MSKSVVIAPEENLIEEVLGHLTPDGHDYSRNVVVFPGKRPAHFLRRRLGERLARSYVPPKVFSIDTFVDFVYVEILGEIRHTLVPLDAVAILHALHRGSPDRLGGASFDTLDAFVPLGLKMFGELEELKMADVSEREVRSSLTPLNNIYGPFYQKVAESGGTTRSLKYWTVAKSIKSTGWEQFDMLVLAGFFALTNAERAMFSRLMALDHVVSIFQRGPGIEKQLQELGIDDRSGSGGDEGTIRSRDPALISRYYRSPDAHGQVFGLAALLKRLAESRGPLDEHTVLILPSSDTLFPVVHHALSVIPEDGYNISRGYPLSRTPIFGFLQSAMNAVASMQDGLFYAPEYIRFALHPYTKNIALQQRTDVARILFHTIEEYFAGEKSRTLFALDELERESSIFERAARRTEAIDAGVSAAEMMEHLRFIHQMTLRKLLAIRNIAGLANACIEIIRFIEKESTARLHPMFLPYLRTLVEALDEVAGSRLAESTFAEPAGYFAFLQHCIGRAEVAFQGTPLRGLQVLGLLETRNLQFDRVILLDADDDAVPGTGSAQTLIPLKVRESLGLPTHHEQEAIVAYYLDLLLKAAREVHFFFIESDRKVKSRYLEQLLWTRQKAEKEEDVSAFISSIRYNVALGHDVPQPIAKTETVVRFLRGFRYTATALDTYLQCPLQFYYTHVLNFHEKEEVSGEIESAEIGSFVHKVLAGLFAPSVGRRLEKDALGTETISRLVDDLFAEFFGNESRSGTQLMKSQVRNHLLSFVEKYQVPILNNKQVELLGIEQVIEVRRGEFLFRGRLDRIEKRGEKIYILDYKTRQDDGMLKIRLERLIREERSTWRDAIGSLQLPLYAFLYSSRFGKPLEDIVPAYLFLGKNQIDETIEVGMAKEGESLTEYYAATEDVLSMLLAEITDAGQPFLATDSLERMCPTCAFRSMCGTQWVRRSGLR